MNPSIFTLAVFATLILPAYHSASQEQSVKARSGGQPQYKCHFTEKGHICELVGGVDGAGAAPPSSGHSMKQEKASAKPPADDTPHAAAPLDNLTPSRDADPFATDDEDSDLFNDYGTTDPGAL